MPRQKRPAPRLTAFPELPTQPRSCARPRNSDVHVNHFGRSVVTKYLLNRLVHIAAAGLCLTAMIDCTTAGSLRRGCATRDLQILMLIEERENSNAISAERLSDAMLTMMNARMLCHDGHEADALGM